MKTYINKIQAGAAQGNSPQHSVRGRTAFQLQDNRVRTGAVVQRAINTQVVPDDPLTPEDQNKMNAVQAYMNTSLQHINSTINTLFVNVKEMRGSNPASTKLNDPKTAIIVAIADWFVRISSVGDICGMLAHEIGVHTLADNRMTQHQKTHEKLAQNRSFKVRVGLHTHEITPWDKGVSVRQVDHINVGRDKGNQQQPTRSANVVNARAVQYAATMLRIGDAIEADAGITQKEKDQRLHDLLSSFLFDYARIIATDDRGARVADKTPLVSQVFNWYKQVILRRYGAAHPWLLRPSMQPTSSTWGLRAYLLAKVTHALAVQAKPGGRAGRAIDMAATGAGMIGGLGMRALGGIGSMISAVTPQAVKTGASAVGSIVGSGLRAADYVYGEAENLVLPKAVGLTGWLLKKGKEGLEMIDTG